MMEVAGVQAVEESEELQQMMIDGVDGELPEKGEIQGRVCIVLTESETRPLPKDVKQTLKPEQSKPGETKRSLVQKTFTPLVKGQKAVDMKRPELPSRVDVQGRSAMRTPDQRAHTRAPFMDPVVQKQLAKPQEQAKAKQPLKQEVREKSSTRENTRAKAQDKAEQRHKAEHEGVAQKEPEKQEEVVERDAREKSEAIDGGLTAKQVKEFMNSPSVLGELLEMRVNHFDVLVLFIEVMKLTLKGRDQQRISRRQERLLQLEHMGNMVENYKQQGKWMLMANLGAGVLAIASGVAPIVGHAKGDWILDKIGGVFSKLRDMNPDKFFKGVTKMTFAMSEMYKSTGQIQNTFAESANTFDRTMSDLHKSDWEEDTRTMEELKDYWKQMEQFLLQSLQTYHDVVRQLYN